MFFYSNNIVKERPKTMLDFYKLLPKYGKKGRTNLMDGAEEVVPIALMALGLDPNTDNSADFTKVQEVPAEHPQGRHDDHSSNYINDGSAGKIILGQGWNGDMRRIVAGPQEAGRHHGGASRRRLRELGRQLVHPAERAAPGGGARLDQLPAARRASRRSEMKYHNYPIPMPNGARQGAEVAAERPAVQRADRSTPNKYQFILNPTPAVVERSAPRSTRSSRPPDDAATPQAAGRRPAGRRLAAVVRAALPGLADGSVVRSTTRSSSSAPMAILVVFSSRAQSGFASAQLYGFDRSQFQAGLATRSYITHLLAHAADGGGRHAARRSLIGYPIAYWMARYLDAYKSLALLLIVVPFWTSFLIRTYALADHPRPPGLRRAVLQGDRARRPIDILYTGRRSGSGWSTTTCRCSSCRSTRRSSGWTGRSSRPRPTSAPAVHARSARSPCG